MQLHNHRLVLALRALNSELAGANRVVAGRLGLNDSDLAVLDVLHRDGPQTPTALARRTRMSPTTMTSVLRRLVRHGWVQREVSEADLRSVTIQPTSIDRLASVFQSANEEFAALVANWPTERADELIEFIEQATVIVRSKTDELASQPPSTSTN